MKRARPNRKGFTLFEVLVALVIASISLSWLLYWLSNALDQRFRLKKKEEFLQSLEVIYATEVASRKDELEALKRGEEIEISREGVTYAFKLINFWPFEEYYLSRVRIEPEGERLQEMWSRFLEIKERREIHLSFIRGEVKKEDRILATLLFPLPGP